MGDWQWMVAIHAFSTLGMVGVIWFVQLVHYPLFARVGDQGFRVYEAEHQRRTTWIVAPLMFAEAGSSVCLAWLLPPIVAPFWYVLGLCLLATVWVSTFFWQVPLHRRLSAGFDAAVHRRLVQSNWLRTWAWTLRGCFALILLAV